MNKPCSTFPNPPRCQYWGKETFHCWRKRPQGCLAVGIAYTHYWGLAACTANFSLAFQPFSSLSKWMCGHVAINCVLLAALQMQVENELYILGRYGSVFLTFAVPLSLILSEGKGWGCWINTTFNRISEQKRKNVHIFLQFTIENLNDYTMFGKIFVCSGLRQKETLSLNEASHPASATQHFLWVTESYILKDIFVEQKSWIRVL